MLAELRIDGHDLLVAEAGIGVEGVLRGADQKAGDDKQHAACGDLGAYKDLADHGLALALAGDLQGGSEAEEDGRSQGNGEGED